jgi:hypothetical protein
MTAQLRLIKIQNRAMLVFANLMDTDKTGTIGYKSIIVKISGFAKFDLDTKINKEHFYQIVEGMCRKNASNGEEGASELDEEKYEQIVAVFEKAYRDGVAPFTGDLENETYKAIVNRMRAFVPQ